ncbi:P-type DNA transfer ATPase VirB11 [Vibrio parahaemolyticus]|uniref:P-type DNA transfer ATPase VirB11 n=1 Tax=Vibrio parahaemolyticus TaxID=670 RepID=UPI002809BAF6|nr:P-type DNA transfer ATPase VirB11 [Vibrio parahaemolyticus]EJE4644415.1 P-type DNA transfer ATPase VirB11 [Vibrio parahaemolyticus]ELA9292962.1 P-type DNA transfer ATPase VirB11 [Vibrio parahaemolyticus]MDS1925658.1 P-type DNA transfer ATPase VirB11 [Vibrio parahaemolyticus]HCG8016765.1 P-type DNA transfer ATPase VirB11 [Vibrio parahaemolyticus]
MSIASQPTNPKAAPPVQPVTDIRGQAVMQLLRPMKPYLDDPTVNELAMNKPGELWTKSFRGWECHDMPVLTDAYMQGLITALVTYNSVGRSSIMYLVLPGGERGTVVLPPSVIDGSLSFLVRKHSQVVKTLEQLTDEGAFDSYKDVSFNKPTEQECNDALAAHDFTRLEPFEAELLKLKRTGATREFLESCVLNKRNIVIAGKTGSGKTTFARSLIEKVPTTERIVTIEDVHELMLDNHPNVVPMLYGYGKGRYPADECLAACMRQTPDRIFLAELRGNEAWEYLNSLNTGHPGSITTVHANNALQTFERIATLVKKSEVGRQLDMEMIKLVLYTTIDVVLFFHERKLVEVFYDPIFAKKQMA